MSENIKSLSIIVPCYNEEGNIPFIINRFKEVVGENPNIEIIIVNNGSTDSSKEILDLSINKINDSRFQVIEVLVNQGYGFGILSGLEKAKNEILAWTHADLQTDPADVISAYELFLKSPQDNIFVKGKRKKRKYLEVFFSWGMEKLSSIILKSDLKDINAQPKMFDRNFYITYLKNGAPFDFSLDLYTLYWAKKTRKIIELPVYFNKRIHGVAKGGGSFKTRIKLIKRTTSYIFKMKKKLQYEFNQI